MYTKKVVDVDVSLSRLTCQSRFATSSLYLIDSRGEFLPLAKVAFEVTCAE